MTNPVDLSKRLEGLADSFAACEKEAIQLLREAANALQDVEGEAVTPEIPNGVWNKAVDEFCAGLGKRGFRWQRSTIDLLLQAALADVSQLGPEPDPSEVDWEAAYLAFCDRLRSYEARFDVDKLTVKSGLRAALCPLTQHVPKPPGEGDGGQVEGRLRVLADSVERDRREPDKLLCHVATARQFLTRLSQPQAGEEED